MKKGIMFMVMASLVIGLLGSAWARELSVWSVSAWINDETMEAYIEAFEKAHPDVKVSWRGLPVKTNMETLQMAGALALKNPKKHKFPDVFLTGPDMRMRTFIAAELIIGLNELFAKAAIDPSLYPGTVFGVVEVEGVYYGLPLAPEVRGVVNINKDVFADAGVPLPDNETSWDELVEMQRKLVVRNAKGEVTRYGSLSKYPVLDLVYAAGAPILDNPLKPTKVLFGEDAFVDVIREFLELADEGVMMPLRVYKALGGSKPKIFGEEKVATMITNCNYKGQFEDMPFDWDVIVLPSPTGGQAKRVHGSSFCWSIYTNTKDRDLAFEWARWVVFSVEALEAKESLRKFNKDEVPYVREVRERLLEIAAGRKPDNWSCLVDLYSRMEPYIGSFQGSDKFSKLFWEASWDVLYERAPIEKLREFALKAQKVIDALN